MVGTGSRQSDKQIITEEADKPYKVTCYLGYKLFRCISCAHTVASGDQRTANELLKQIKQHSSPFGDGTQRLSHYFANALEVRLAGTRTPDYTPLVSNGTSAADILKAYRVYVTACPFKRMSNVFANRTIRKLVLSQKATRVHIIDFGILYGFQWPCLIQRLSERPGGPPKLRITGIELPQPGFWPAERVEETGRRLENYCKRFNVPFEYSNSTPNTHEYPKND
ncbi:scarecrow-like protein 14 [Carya illinoinensis]|uniref:scarecrow-like protein 14 n=1 Tax=Carya illinoinensis TaxID=32201 RepID=UPI001C71E791|nr:scarecrow-like protein 14 [Carya illinoinensis]